MSETSQRCRHVGDGQRFTDEHRPECEDPGCAGCKPCQRGHCKECGHRHLDQHHTRTCPTCINAVRDDMRQIIDMGPRLPIEAIHRGINSQAAMLAGPVADVEAWRNRYNSAFWGRIDSAWLEDCRDEAHPLWVLGTWDLLVTQHYGHERTQRVTVEDAAAYLGRNLTDLAQDEDFAFGELARDIRQCRGHLEDVLRDGNRDEKGAPCPSCSDGDRKGPALVKRYLTDEDDMPLGPEFDQWFCTLCRQKWTEAEYRLRVGTDYRQHATALTASDIHTTYRVAPGTVRQWALRGKVAKLGRDHSGRQMYDVADVLAMRDGIKEPA